MWVQKDIILPQFSRGFHIITDEIIDWVPEIEKISVKFV